MLSNTPNIKNGKSLPLQAKSQENNHKTISGLGRYIGIVDNSEVTKTMKTETAHHQDIITEQPRIFNFDDNAMIDTGKRKSITRNKVSICPPSFRQVHSCIGTCLGFESLRSSIVNYDGMACFHSDWKGKPFKCQGINIIKLKLGQGDLKLSASDGNIIVEPPPFDYPRRESDKTFDYYMRTGTVNACLPTNTIKKVQVGIRHGSLSGTIHTEGEYIVTRGTISVEISSDATIIPKTKGDIIASGYSSELITDDKDDSGYPFPHDRNYKYIPKQKCESTHTEHEKKIYLISKKGKIKFTHLSQK